MHGSNFDFLQQEHRELYHVASAIEADVFTAPLHCLHNARQYMKLLIATISQCEDGKTGSILFDDLVQHRGLPAEDAAWIQHISTSEQRESFLDVSSAIAYELVWRIYTITTWYYRTYINSDYPFRPYVSPRPEERSVSLATDHPATPRSCSTEETPCTEVLIDGQPRQGDIKQTQMYSSLYREISFPNGEMYKGEWKDGARHGYGTYIWKDGTKYEGMWNRDVEQGRGSKYFANGDTYTGEWADGMFDGTGTYRWNDGSTYTGEWAESMMHGHGKQVTPEGVAVDGIWSYGERQLIADQQKQQPATNRNPSWPRTIQ